MKVVIALVLGLASAATSPEPNAFRVRTRAEIDRAAQALGFCVAQDMSLDHAAKRHPELTPRVELTRHRFQLDTGDGCGALAKELERVVSAAGENWPETLAKMKSGMKPEMFKPLDDVSIASAFLDEVAARGKGRMDAELLRTVLDASAVFRGNPVSQLDLHYEFYDMREHPKAHGVAAKIRVPKAWKADEANGEHIVRKWTQRCGDTDLAMLILQFHNATEDEVAEIKSELASDSSVAELAGEFAEMAGMQIVEGPKRIVLAGHPGFEMVGTTAGQQMDQTFVQRMKHYFVLHDRGMVILGGSVVVAKASEANLEPLFKTYSPLFLRVANSMTFPITD